MLIDHRKVLAEFQEKIGKEKEKLWRKWKKNITNFHLTIILSTSEDPYYQKEAWKVLKKSKPEMPLLKAVVKYTVVEEIRLAAAKLLLKKSKK